MLRDAVEDFWINGPTLSRPDFNWPHQALTYSDRGCILWPKLIVAQNMISLRNVIFMVQIRIWSDVKGYHSFVPWSGHMVCDKWCRHPTCLCVFVTTVLVLAIKLWQNSKLCTTHPFLLSLFGKLWVRRLHLMSESTGDKRHNCLFQDLFWRAKPTKKVVRLNSKKTELWPKFLLCATPPHPP